MEKDLIILCLLAVIVLLSIALCFSVMADNQPVAAPAKRIHPEFPADELLEAIKKDFDQLELKWKRTEHGSMDPKSRNVPQDVPKREAETHNLNTDKTPIKKTMQNAEAMNLKNIKTSDKMVMLKENCRERV